MLKGLFRQVPLNGNTTFMPVLRASVILGVKTSFEVDGLLDTGAAINLISMSSSKALLGMSSDEVKKGRLLSISGVGGGNSHAYGWQVNLRLRSTTISSDYFLWKSVWLYVCEASLPPIAQILIGQSDGFEEKVFVHLNRHQKRYWLVKT